MLKRVCFVCAGVALLVVLMVAPATFAQTAQTGSPSGAVAEKAKSTKDEPFDPHDLNGVWQTRLENTNNGLPPFTPEGKAKWAANKPGFGPRAVPLAEGNDPIWACNPLGLPRALITIVRPIQFIQTKNQLVQLFLMNEVWRIIWTDGRALPTNPPEIPRFTGYSVGHWDGNTFVVETTGLDERTWLESYGDPHSDMTSFEERYTRVDHDTIELVMTITDPKIFTKPWVTEKEVFKLKPELILEQQEICVPSESEVYTQSISNAADPGAHKK